MVNRTSRALAGGVFIWIFFNIIWDLVTFGILAATEGMPTDTNIIYPDWYRYITSINPNTSFGLAVNQIADGISLPDLLNVWTLMGILVIWIVVPMIITFFVFDRKDF